jgi:hypothetical protein
VAVPRADLEQKLRAHYRFLKGSGEAFDGGYEDEAMRLATSVRLLVHHGQGRPLLHLLGVQKNITYLDTAGALIPGNMLSENHLTVMRVGEDGWSEIAPLDNVPRSTYVSFNRWWTTAVVKDHPGETWNRRDLVLAVANEDGGAHVDPTLTGSYNALSRDNSMGWATQSSRDPVLQPLPNPVPLCVRQIAHELTRTFERNLWQPLGLAEPGPESASA